MWLATRFGFFSVVQYEGSTNTMVRARVREHLDELKRHFQVVFDAEIVEWAGTDYQYRIIVTREQWLSLATSLAADIDYGNFKAKAHESLPGDDSYQRFLMDTWSSGFDMQWRATPQVPVEPAEWKPGNRRRRRRRWYDRASSQAYATSDKHGWND